VIILAALLVFNLTACDSFEERLAGFIAASVFMADETNINSSAEITIKLSDNAKSVSLADFVTAAVAADPAELSSIEISMAIESKIYENNAELTIYWTGSEGREELIRVIFTGEDLYISTAVLENLKPFLNENEEVAAITEIIGDADYLRIQVSSLENLAALYNEKLPHSEIDFAALILGLKDDAGETLKDAIELLITEDFAEALQEIDGEYSLTLNTDIAIEFIKAALRLFVEHDSEIIDYAANIWGKFGVEISGAEIAEANDSWAARILEALSFMETSEFTENIPAVNFEHRVKATGEGEEKVQTTSTWLEIASIATLHDKDSVFEEIELSVTTVTKIQSAPITIPQGKIFSLDEILSGVMGDMLEGWVLESEDLETVLNDFGLDLERFASEIDKIASDFGIDIDKFNLDDFNMDDIDIDIEQIGRLLDSFGFGSFIGR
jgi:hypothetical protein